jgi:hypothetical protein
MRCRVAIFYGQESAFHQIKGLDACQERPDAETQGTWPMDRDDDNELHASSPALGPYTHRQGVLSGR